MRSYLLFLCLVVYSFSQDEFCAEIGCCDDCCESLFGGASQNECKDGCENDCKDDDERCLIGISFADPNIATFDLERSTGGADTGLHCCKASVGLVSEAFANFDLECLLQGVPTALPTSNPTSAPIQPLEGECFQQDEEEFVILESEDSFTFDQAFTACGTFSSDFNLASMRNRDAMAFVTQILIENNLLAENIYFGLNRPADEQFSSNDELIDPASFVFTDQTNFNDDVADFGLVRGVFPWATDQPDNSDSDENCVIMSDGQWNDVSCSTETKLALCKRPCELADDGLNDLEFSVFFTSALLLLCCSSVGLAIALFFHSKYTRELIELTVELKIEERTAGFEDTTGYRTSRNRNSTLMRTMNEHYISNETTFTENHVSRNTANLKTPKPDKIIEEIPLFDEKNNNEALDDETLKSAESPYLPGNRFYGASVSAMESNKTPES